MSGAEKQAVRFHDPLILEEGGRYYSFSTDIDVEGVQMGASGDLAEWELLGPALPEVPAEVRRHVGCVASGPRAGKVNFWAPEVIRDGASGGEYRLYFCSSQFGTSQSMIGLAASGAIDGSYDYRGCVVKTYHSGGAYAAAAPNAIDPCVARDRDGSPWLAYGSFFGGIYIAPLDDDGFMAAPGYGKRIAGGGHTPVEGAYIRYDGEGDRFCLFLSYGSLLRDYRITAAYSANIDGPYADSAGRDMADLDPVLIPGDKIAGGYNFDIPGAGGFMAPGHNSLLVLDDGWHMVYHIRREGVANGSAGDAPACLHIRKVFFSSARQVFVSPAPRGKGAPQAPPESALTGPLSVIRHDPCNNGVTYGRKLDFADLGLRVGERGPSSSSCAFRLCGTDYEGAAFMQDGAVYVTGISPGGECLWATNQAPRQGA